MTFTRIGGDVIDYLEEVQDAICVHSGAGAFHDRNTPWYRRTPITIHVVKPQLPVLFKSQQCEEDVSKGTVSVALVRLDVLHVVSAYLSIHWHILSTSIPHLPASSASKELMPGSGTHFL